LAGFADRTRAEAVDVDELLPPPPKEPEAAEQREAGS